VGYYAASSNNVLPTFRGDDLSVPSSVFKNPKDPNHAICDVLLTSYFFGCHKMRGSEVSWLVSYFVCYELPLGGGHVYSKE
jgi:hypothetical protein